MARHHTSSGAIWEQKVAYRRAVRIGNTIEVSGTTSTIDGAIVHAGDAYLQAKTCLSIIIKAIEELGGQASDIIRTRIYVCDIIRDWEEIGRAHFEFFNEYPPASTMIGGVQLIDPALLVEIEASAIIEK